MSNAITTLDAAAPPPAGRPVGDPEAADRTVDWRRLSGPVAGIAVGTAAVAAVGQTLGTVVAGRLAESPTAGLVALLAALVVGAAVLDTVGRIVWAGVVDRAEGALRADLLTATLHQPLETLSEQAVGEILDRVDDDTHEVGTLVRQELWGLFQTVFGLVPMWLVAGLTWWPAFIIFPIALLLTLAVMRPLMAEIARRKVLEEMAWTDHAAALEEGIAARDDLRTSLGQPHMVARLASLAAESHRRFERVVRVEAAVARRAGLLLAALLSGIAVVGVALASGGDLSVAQLVTLFLVTSTFVGEIDQFARHLPELQAGLGAVIRIRQMMALEPEPTGGDPLPEGSLSVEVRDLTFSYLQGEPVLHDVQLVVPAGETVALVGRTGSGKSTIASLLSRAVEPPAGTVLLGGADVRDLDLQDLRAAVGVVTQRTEILAGSLADNVALFDPLIDRRRVEAAVEELGLGEWAAGLPDGLDTLLGPGGTTLSAGEEQLVAFARLLVREVRVVILDEATARMDPITERRVVRAADRLLRGRTGVMIAHRLGTTERADQVVVLEGGRVIQAGRRAELATRPGPFAALLAASDDRVNELADESSADRPTPDSADATDLGGGVGVRRRVTDPPVQEKVGTGPSLARGIARVLAVTPQWGIVGALGFGLSSLVGAYGAITGWAWGTLVEGLAAGQTSWGLTVVVVLALVANPLILAVAFYRYPRWWVEVLLRVRMQVLVGQTAQRRLPRTPAGEVVARALDADRYVRYADRWVDFVNGLAVAAVTAIAGGSWLAGGVLLTVMVVSAGASALGRPVAGRSAAESSAARARFGRALVSAVESARTVKLAAATPAVHRHLRRIDGGRVRAAIFEHRIQAFLDGVPQIMVQVGVVAAWFFFLDGWWGLATALLVANAVNGFDWFGRVAGAVVTEAPGTRAWQRETSRLAGGVDLADLPPGVDLVVGTAPPAAPGRRETLRSLRLRDFTAVHDDGTEGVGGVDLDVAPGELVLLLGRVGSGKSSLLASLAGLVAHRGSLQWNEREVDDAQTFLRPGNVAYIGQVPRVLSGSFADNVALGHPDRAVGAAVDAAQMSSDVANAGGIESLVGHRGVRLSGGQVQRLALARALAADAEILLADDVSSALDATTETELWATLRSMGLTVIGATSKRAALSQADRVVVLDDGRVVDSGPWSELSTRWDDLAG